jgi:hypothetical protein
MTPRRALAFIRQHGVVLQAAKGLELSFAAKVAGAPIKGSWWAHPKSHEIFDLLQKIHDSPAVLVCTLAGGRITYVHRRLWPAFIRLAGHFRRGALDQVREVHTSSGRHERRDVAFPDWAPKPVLAEARSLSVAKARAQIEVWLERYGT